MTNIVFLYEREIPTLEELYKSFQYLEKKYQVGVKKVRSVDFSMQSLKECDVVICVRGQSPMTYGVLKLVQKHKKLVFFFLDDDLKDLPKNTFGYPERKRWLLKCLGLCSGLITSNRLIAEEYGDLIAGDKIILLNTAVNPDLIEKPKKVDGKIKIVYAASEGHAEVFSTYVSEAVRKLTRDYGELLEIYFIGNRPKFRMDDMYHNIFFVPNMKMNDYIQYMKENKFDIGIAVLQPTHFTERKYFNKFIEYTRYGICGVYSKCMPYELVVKDGINGFFTENTSECWYGTLEKAIECVDLRYNCINNAQIYLKKEHNEEYIFAKLVADCPELINFVSCKQSQARGIVLFVYKIRHICFRIIESVYLTISSLLHFGCKETWDRIKRKL